MAIPVQDKGRAGAAKAAGGDFGWIGDGLAPYA